MNFRNYSFILPICFVLGISSLSYAEENSEIPEQLPESRVQKYPDTLPSELTNLPADHDTAQGQSAPQTALPEHLSPALPEHLPSDLPEHLPSDLPVEQAQASELGLAVPVAGMEIYADDDENGDETEILSDDDISGTIETADAENQSLKLPNPEYIIEKIHISGNYRTSRERILKIMELEENAQLTIDELEECRIRLAVSGLFENVDMSLAPGKIRSSLNIQLKLEERSPFQVNQYYIGTDPKSPYWHGLDVSWIAPFNAPHRFRMTYAATSSNDYTLAFYYLIPSVAKLPLSIMLSIQSTQASEGIFGKMPDAESNKLRFTHLDDLSFERHGAYLGLGYTPYENIRIFLRIQYMRLESDNDIEMLTPYVSDFIRHGGSSLTSANLSFSYDSRSGHMLANSGHTVNLSVGGTFRSGISDYNYLKMRLTHESNIQLGRPEHILRINTYFGAVIGDAPFFDKFFYNDFYALAPSRIGYLNPSQRGAFDIFDTGADTLSYEDYIGIVNLIYAWQLIPSKFEIFAQVGAIWSDSKDRKALRLGINSGNERESFPVDLSLNAGIRMKTDYGLFSVTLGHIFNLIPR